MFDIIMPKLGESIIEATITKWLKKEGDAIVEDDAIVEIATDKVDSEIPSPVAGILVQLLFKEGDVVPVGQVIARVDMGGGAKEVSKPEPPKENIQPEEKATPAAIKVTASYQPEPVSPSGRFYSPLVKSMAREEGISMAALETIMGSGKEGRVTKEDVLKYLEARKSSLPGVKVPKTEPVMDWSGDDTVIEMDRVRQLIAGHMIKSVQTSAHVTSFVEIDMTRIVRWREKHKDAFRKREKIKLTFTPVILEAIARAVKDIPGVIVSVDGNKIIQHKHINIGMAVALPNFNLIVPVIRDADQKSLLGITKTVNDLAERARNSKLVPDEISGGTISFTNLGSFGTLMGTPIINQPQTAIVAAGAIKKRPVVLETPEGDTIAIRHVMIASLSYDHRVIDGALAGRFLERLTYHLEHFFTEQSI